MKTFEIYVGPSGEIEVVKRGFSWPAALLGAFWAFYKRLWFTGGAIFVAGVALRFLDESAAKGGFAVMGLLLHLGATAFVGFNANSWRTAKLKSLGYEFQKRINAETPQQAMAQYRLRSVRGEDDPMLPEVIAA